MYTSNCERALKFGTEVPHKVKKLKIERDTLENDVSVDVSIFLQKFDLRKTLTYYIPLERKFNSEQLFCLREITKMNSVKDISS